MSAEPIDPAPVRFDAPARENRDGDVIPFYLGEDDTVLIARRPKMAALMNLAKGLESDNDLEKVRVFDEFLDTVLEPESAEYLRDRFDDPEDDLDLDALDKPLQYLVGRWYKRPTGSRPASQRSPRRTGKASTVRARSKG
jgi:hypothetical protein